VTVVVPQEGGWIFAVCCKPTIIKKSKKLNHLGIDVGKMRKFRAAATRTRQSGISSDRPSSKFEIKDIKIPKVITS
jgi:hypothetical protein